MSLAKNYTSLDFDSIKQDLRQYLETQDKLRDYNYDGALMSVLLDVLSYNTMTNAVYANMSASERFLSTAQLRSSVVSLAKNIGYLPRSVKSAKSNVTVSLTYDGNDSPSSILLPKNTKFTTTNSDGTSLTFFNRSDVYLEASNDIYSASFDIYEGRQFTFTETIQENQNGILIPNAGVDTELLSVTVKPNVNSSTEVIYTQSNDFTENTSQSNVYYIEETDNKQHRLYFGEGVVGSAITQGNVVVIEYYISNGEQGNGVNTFSLSSTPNDTQLNSIIVNSVASGGVDIESIESIKDNAPKFYQAQNRAVTARDYIPIVKQQFSDVQDVSVWGGETVTPPSYGKVFIAVTAKFGDALSQSRKNEIESILKAKYSVMTIDVDVIDPKYIYLIVTNKVKFSSSNTSTTAFELKSQIRSSIQDYDALSLSAFDKDFRLSVLASKIDTLNSSIESNTIDVKLSIRPPDIEDVSVTQTLDFNNEVVPDSLETSTFDWNGFTNVYLKDDGKGNINIYRLASGIEVPITDTQGSIKVAGTLNYTNGLITFNPNVFNVLDISRVYNQAISFNAAPVLDDILSDREKVLRITQADTFVSVEDTVTGIIV